MSASVNVEPVTKRRKVPASIRQPQILALQAAGMTQEQIAQQMGVSRQSITRDLREIAPAKEAVVSKLASLVDEISVLLPSKRRAEEYASLATSAKNEAVRLGTLQRIDDLDGIVTEKELVRSKRNDPPAPTAMFMLPAGTSISFGVSVTSEVTPTATGSVPGLEHDVIDVTPLDEC